jgi:UDP-N-acetylglucosamine--N-acetylmuramyl-(pentapeptide) pyrophosphoryl-undecaprenol N-acetylglucosamine transferase
MKIVFTGGGTGGHFYPIIAVAEAVHEIVDQEKLLGLKMYYFSDAPYDKEALFENAISYRYIPAGKLRRYFSIKNFIDIFKTAIGTLQAFITLLAMYPDVIFSKGGYGSFPIVLAARILHIPVVFHESDSAPGRVNAWTGKFAKNIAVSYDEATAFFPKERTAVTGQPIRQIIRDKKTSGAFEYLKLDPSVPTLFIIGGSLGAEAINNIIIDSLPQLVQKYQIIHQTGIANFTEVKGRADFILAKSEFKDRYKPFAFLNPLAIKMAAGASSLVITRAGSTLFEIASWGLPAIIIPIVSSNNDHQRKNAFNYARHGGGIVIEEGNLSPTILIAEVDRFFKDPTRREKMAEAAQAFAVPDAAEKIARVLVDIALSHEE